MNRWVLKRIAQDEVHGRIYGHKEIRPEPGNPVLVPVEGLRKLRFGPNDQPVRHFRLAILSRTTGQESPAAGSLW